MTLPTEKAKKIRLAIFDVDGVLTTGKLIYSSEGECLKEFNVRDGLGLQLLQKSGVKVAIITARNSLIVERRMQDLGITHVYQGQKNKLIAYRELKELLEVSDDEIAYLGDDLPDLPVLLKVGLAATVNNAPAIIQDHVHYKTHAEGGHGAARELCEFIMQAQGTFAELMKPYLEEVV